MVALILVFPAKAETTGNFQIVIDPITKKITIVMNTGSMNTGAGTGIITPPAPVYTGTEFQQALARMYANGLTKYSNETDYRADDGLTREEAAKIIGQAFVKLGYAQETKNSSCGFTDSNEVDPTLASFVVDTCKR